MEDAPPIRFELRRGAVTALPLAIAVGLFGVSFGVLSATSGGMGALPAVVMSATTFAGSAQFAAASVVSAGGGPVTAIAAALLLNARYLPIGISVARFLRGGPLRRFLAAQLVVDESWAIAAEGGGQFDAHRLIGAGVMLWLAWVAGTIVGVVGGEALGDPAALGLDAAFPALFLALLVPQLDGRRAVAAALLGGAIALVLVPFTPPGVPIIAAGAAAFIGLLEAMSEVWVIVLAIGLGTMAIKAAGPVLLGGRALPTPVRRVVALLAPALLAALVATAAFGSAEGLVLDARAVGLAVGAAAIVLRAPVLAVVIAAAVAAALVRLL